MFSAIIQYICIIGSIAQVHVVLYVYTHLYKMEHGIYTNIHKHTVTLVSSGRSVIRSPMRPAVPSTVWPPGSVGCLLRHLSGSGDMGV